MPRARFRTFTKGLLLTPPADETPKEGLRRARNVGPLLDGRLTIAPPFKLLEDVGISSAIHSITRYGGRLFAGLGSVLRRNAPGWATVSLPAAFTPSGDTGPVVALSGSPLRFIKAPPQSDIQEYLFVVDQGSTGRNLFKVAPDGTASRWGIKPPTANDISNLGFGLDAQNSKYINGATPGTDPIEDVADWTLDSDSGSGSNQMFNDSSIAIDGTAIRVETKKNDTVTLTRTFTAIDLTTFGGGIASGDEDFITIFVRFRRPKHVKSMEIAFATNNAVDFTNKIFSREINFKLVNRAQRKRLIGTADLIPLEDQQQFLLDHKDQLRDLSSQELMGEQRFAVANQMWTRLTLPKATFTDSGDGADWSNVRGIRFSFESTNEGGIKVNIDSLKLIGGIGMVGDYQYTLTYKNSTTGTRSNPAIDDDGNILKRTVEDVERQGVAISGFAAAGALDPQADVIEIWRTMGNGTIFFLAGEHRLGGATYHDTCADYAGLDADNTEVVSGVNTSFAFLVPDETLPLDNGDPNDDEFQFRDAVGPHYGRMWWFNNADSGGGAGNGYYSPIGRLESVAAFIQITSGDSDPTRKGQIWNDRLFVLSQEGLYEIVGTDEPFIARKVEGAPGTLLPNTFVAASIGLFWFAPDGVYYFDGTSAVNITDQSLLPIFHMRDAIEDFSASSIPDIAEAGRNSLWMADGTGSEFTYVFDFDTRAWRYREKVTALYYDSFTGNMLGSPIGGGSFDDIYTLEPFPFDNTGVAQTVTIQTSEVRAGPGVKGVLRKLYLDIDTVNEAAVTVDLLIDGTVVALGTLSVATGRRVPPVEFNVNRAGERFAVRISGTSINEPVVIYGIEMDLYVPGSAAADIGS